MKKKLKKKKQTFVDDTVLMWDFRWWFRTLEIEVEPRDEME